MNIIRLLLDKVLYTIMGKSDSGYYILLYYVISGINKFVKRVNDDCGSHMA